MTTNPNPNTEPKESTMNRYAGRSIDTDAFRRACDRAYDLCDGHLVAVIERFDEGTEIAPAHHELAGEELGRMYIVDEAGMTELDDAGVAYQVLESYGCEAALLGDDDEAECSNPNHGAFIAAGVPCDCAVRS